MYLFSSFYSLISQNHHFSSFSSPRSHPVVGRSLKCIRKNLAWQIQKNSRNINWYICYELSKAGKFHTFLVSLIILLSWPERFRSSFATRNKIFSINTYQPALNTESLTRGREARPNTAPFFSKVGLRKFVLAKGLFVLRSYFIRYLTYKRRAKLSWFSLQIIFSIECYKPQSR